MLFDLLELDGTDMRREPIEVRKATWPASCARADTACDSTNTSNIRTGWPVQHACRRDLEGIVSTRMTALRFRPVAGLAKVQEPGGAGAQAEEEGGGERTGFALCVRRQTCA